MRTDGYVWGVILTTILMGCANLGSIYRDLDTSAQKGALVDVKQRAIIVGSRTEKAKDQSQPDVKQTVVCPEPSPDAMTSLAAELSGDATLTNGTNAKLAAAIQDSSAFVGLRTASIQLLRDQWFSDCLAYMNGAIDGLEYALLARRFQRDTVALMTIEALTGTVRVPTVISTAEGAASVARSLSELRAESTQIDKEIAELTRQQADAKANKSDTTAIDSQIAGLNADKKAIGDAIASAQGQLALGKASMTVSSVGVPSARSDQHVQAVAQIVEEIARWIVNSEDDFVPKCFNLLTKTYKPDDPNSPDAQLRAACVEAIKSNQQDRSMQLRAKAVVLGAVERCHQVERTTIAVKKCVDAIGGAELLQRLGKGQPPGTYDMAAERLPPTRPRNGTSAEAVKPQTEQRQ